MAEAGEWAADSVAWEASSKGTKGPKVTFSEVASSANAVFCCLWTQSPILSLTRYSPVLQQQESHPPVNAANAC